MELLVATVRGLLGKSVATHTYTHTHLPTKTDLTRCDDVDAPVGLILVSGIGDADAHRRLGILVAALVILQQVLMVLGPAPALVLLLDILTKAKPGKRTIRS